MPSTCFQSNGRKCAIFLVAYGYSQPGFFNHSLQCMNMFFTGRLSIRETIRHTELFAFCFSPFMIRQQGNLLRANLLSQCGHLLYVVPGIIKSGNQQDAQIFS